MKRLLAGLVLVAFALSVQATDFHVTDLEGLTNAIASVRSQSDVIYLAEHTYDLTGVTSANAASHFYIGYLTLCAEEGAVREKVVLRANGLRHFYMSKGLLKMTGLTLENGYSSGNCGCVRLENTDDSGIVATNCLFRNNRADASYGVFQLATRGAQYMVKPRIFHGCGFVGNSVGNYYAVGETPQAIFTDCGFTNNVAGLNYAGIVSGKGFASCSFVGNRGGSLFLTGSDVAPVVSDCVFFGNAGALLSVPDGYALTVTNCVFGGNRQPSGSFFSTNADKNQKIVFNDCLFTNNVSTNSYIFKSETYNSLWGMFLSRCRVMYNESLGAEVFARVLADNCLIVSNAAAGTHNNSCFASSSLFRNCTLAYNVKNGTIYRSILNTSSVAVNTLLIDNEPNVYRNTSDPAGSWFLMTNCVWTAQSDTNDTFTAWLKQYGMDGRLIAPERLKFDPETPYLPRYGSPLRDTGWSDETYLSTVGAADVAGRERVMFKSIDVGAYECQKMPGLLLLVR